MSEITAFPPGAYVLINTFETKPGKLDEFIHLQIAEAQRLGAAARRMGWIGNQIHRSIDSESAIIVTVFQTKEAQREFSDSVFFKQHLVRIGPLLERVTSRPCELIFRSDGEGSVEQS